MKPSFFLFWTFIKRLGKEWILWLFLALDGLAAFVQLIFPSINLPQSVYGWIFIIGLIWASFKTYLDLLVRIPGEARPLQPNISIFFSEGDEYSYKILQLSDVIPPESLKLFEKAEQEDSATINLAIGKKLLPHTRMMLHMRIENLGLVAVNLLNIVGSIDYLQTYGFDVPEISNPDGTSVSFPIKLAPKQLLHFQIITTIRANSLFSAAQIAARTRKLKEDRASFKAEVSTEVIDPAGKTYNYSTNQQISLLPFCNLYISLWDSLGRHDLVSLATGEINSTMRDEIDKVPNENTSKPV